MWQKYFVVGSGNVAWHLVRWLRLHGRDVFVKGRNHQAVSSICQNFGAVSVEVIPDDLFHIVFYAVRDDAVQQVSGQNNFQKATEVHLSGTLPMHVLNGSKRGVMWPMASLVKFQNQELTDIPWVLQGELNWSDILPMKKTTTVDEDLIRRKMHLSAVVLNNFVYRLGVLTSRFLERQNLEPFEHILKQTTTMLVSEASAKNQTGPAARGDYKTIETHLAMLENHCELKEIYQQLSAGIAKSYEEKL
ncbi:MAG: DUF2520 domain-containing protein [Cryomorphaceae bacterium]|nr:DUF2520 domain-containing protein [Cryomorphaceae bacterium]